MTTATQRFVYANQQPTEENTIDCLSHLAAVDRSPSIEHPNAYAEDRSHVRIYLSNSLPAGNALQAPGVVITLWSRFRGGYQVRKVFPVQLTFGFVGCCPISGDGLAITVDQDCLVTIAVDRTSIDPWEFP